MPALKMKKQEKQKKKSEMSKEKKQKKKVKVQPLVPTEYNVEIRLLTLSDLKDSMKVFENAKFDITKGEVEHILQFDMSYGAFVNRKLMAVGLAWPANFDPKEVTVTISETPNAMYLEDVAIFKKSEGRRIRSMLITSRENESIKRGLDYVVTQESKDPMLKDLIEAAYINYLKYKSKNNKVYMAKHLEYPLMEDNNSDSQK